MPRKIRKWIKNNKLLTTLIFSSFIILAVEGDQYNKNKKQILSPKIQLTEQKRINKTNSKFFFTSESTKANKTAQELQKKYDTFTIEEQILTPKAEHLIVHIPQIHSYEPNSTLEDYINSGYPNFWSQTKPNKSPSSKSLTEEITRDYNTTDFWATGRGSLPSEDMSEDTDLDKIPKEPSDDPEETYHWSSPRSWIMINEKITDHVDAFEKINACQRKIYNITKELAEKLKINTFYLEGILKEYEKELNDSSSRMSKYVWDLEYLDSFGYIKVLIQNKEGDNAEGSLHAAHQKIVKFESGNTDISKQEYEQAKKELEHGKFIPSGTFLYLVENENLKLKGAENSDAYNAAYSHTEHNIFHFRTPEYMEKILENRETGTLQKIVDDGTKVAFMVFGAGHDWKNNIIEWNQTHENHKFSYIKLNVPEATLD